MQSRHVASCEVERTDALPCTSVCFCGKLCVAEAAHAAGEVTPALEAVMHLQVFYQSCDVPCKDIVCHAIVLQQ